jgi:hypothetical protein
MTVQATINDFRICQAHLGRKIHDAKDPSEHLGPMFREVVSTLFQLMEETEAVWKPITGAQPVETFGEPIPGEPDPIEVNLPKLMTSFKNGLDQLGPLWRDIFCADCFEALAAAASIPDDKFRMPSDTWVRVLYELAATYHQWPANRRRLVDLMTPLYYGRVASFINETRDMDSLEAEQVVEAQAELFVDAKDFLVQVWNTPRPGMSKIAGS